MRYNGPKNRIARRENMDLGMKTPGSKAHASLLKKINILPGQHGTKGRRKKSEHSRQLREKQKLRYSFGITETQLKNYFGMASKRRGNTSVNLSEILERRLDNIIYRLGFAPTRAAARQLVSHGHVAVNGKSVKAASYQVADSDAITFANENTKKIPYIEAYMTQTEVILPEWLQVKKDAGTLVSTPNSSLIEKQVNLRLVIEYYSR
ncbi:MAG TPA: 30S ribosomal protein S4 [Candidatus Woesebacteria bacterium]|nr:30S ribosomal protein S4 [Candidatus Woesebacteria bacterium]